jgi:hypothetical protein
MIFTDLSKFDRPDAIGAAGTNIAVRDCEFINIGYGVNANAKPTGLLVQDSLATRPEAVRSYFIWAQGSDMVFVGNTVANSTRDHNIRVVGVDRISITHNDLTNLTNTGLGRHHPQGYPDHPQGQLTSTSAATS